MAVIDYARNLDFASGVYLCGHSQGGLTAMLAAGLEHDRIRGLILRARAFLIPRGARAGNLLGQPVQHYFLHPERGPYGTLGITFNL